MLTKDELRAETINLSHDAGRIWLFLTFGYISTTGHADLWRSKILDIMTMEQYDKALQELTDKNFIGHVTEHTCYINYDMLPPYMKGQ